MSLSLQVIDISHCVRHVTDNGIHHLSNLPRLEELKLTNLKMLTDNTLLAIIARQKLQVCLPPPNNLRKRLYMKFHGN